MNTQSGLSRSEGKNWLHLSGMQQKAAILLWGLITILSLISLAYSIISLNLWDRVPAADAPRYFPDMTPENIQLHADWQNTVLQSGLSLSGYALIFTLARVIGGMALFIVGFMIIRRYGNHLLAALLAILLSVFAAAGIWNNPLFPWGVALAPWLNYPVQFLGWLVWCGAIVIYMFPDGKFTPRWTFWLAVLVVPVSFTMSFNIDIFLNPNNWGAPVYFLDNILFIGGALGSVIYRYRKTQDVEQRHSMRLYVWGISLLIGLYFIYYFMVDLYPWLAGQALFQSYESRLTYVLWSEPIWFAFEVIFAIGLALSIFRDNLMEKSARQG